MIRHNTTTTTITTTNLFRQPAVVQLYGIQRLGSEIKRRDAVLDRSKINK
jgi:hypothetical protein